MKKQSFTIVRGFAGSHSVRIKTYHLSVAILIFLLSVSSVAQTIHKEDLPYFVGKFPAIDSAGERIIDCSHFVEWFIARPDSTGRRPDLKTIKHSRGSHWIVKWHGALMEETQISYQGLHPRELLKLHFLVFNDFGHEVERNVLTVWELLAHDSVRYRCGQAGPELLTSISGAWVRRVTIFPDSSLLLVVQTEGCDEECWGSYLFFRGTTRCDFTLLHRSGWGRVKHVADLKYMFYNFDNLISPSYQISEVSEFITFEPKEWPAVRYRIDSATVKVIDLWELAKKHFQIEE